MNKSIISNDFFFLLLHVPPRFLCLLSDFGRCVSGSHIVISRCYKLFVLIGEPIPFCPRWLKTLLLNSRPIILFVFEQPSQMRCLLRILEQRKSLLYVRLLPFTHSSVGYPVLGTVVPVVLTPVLLLVRPVFFPVSLSPFLRGSEDLFPVFLVVRSVLLPCCEIAHCIQVLPDVLHIACVPGNICHLCSFARHRKPCIIHSPCVH
jgi:hypothetical protein